MNLQQVIDAVNSGETLFYRVQQAYLSRSGGVDPTVAVQAASSFRYKGKMGDYSMYAVRANADK